MLLQIKDACAKVFDLAQRLYGVDLASYTEIKTDLLGSYAGLAIKHPWANPATKLRVARFYTLRFNPTLFERNPDFMLNNVVPHEIAHLVAFHCPHLGADHHNRQWSLICLALGGDGKRLHSEPVYYARGATYAYTASNGKVLHFSQTRHNQIQRGRSFRPKGGGLIDRTSPFVVVGYNGQPTTKDSTDRLG